MAKTAEFEDDEFGVVKVKYNTLARRLIFRKKEGVIVVTAPCSTPLNFIKTRLRENVVKLRKLSDNRPQTTLRGGDVIETQCFNIAIHSHSHPKLLFSLKEGVLNIFIPASADIENADFQTALKQKIVKVVKRFAEPYLSARLQELAARCGVTYNEFTLSYGKRRLGVCNTKKRISLSVNLIFYPQHLVDYVIFHELAHLTEMNHGARFHALCNHYCGGREQELERELKKFCLPL